MPGKSKKSKRIDAWVRRNSSHHACSCGCGEFIPIKRSHYREGIPKFLKGHNFTGAYNPKTDEEAPPIPSLWDKLSEEERKRRLSQLKNFPKGEDHPNWAGGVHITDSGYRHIRMTEHPHSVDGYFPEHRLVVEMWMQKNNPTHEFMVCIDDNYYLNRTTVVHHRDENKLNNSIEKLVLMDSQSTHLSWHMRDCEEYEKFEEYKSRIYCDWIWRANAIDDSQEENWEKEEN